MPSEPVSQSVSDGGSEQLCCALVRAGPTLQPSLQYLIGIGPTLLGRATRFERQSGETAATLGRLEIYHSAATRQAGRV